MRLRNGWGIRPYVSIGPSAGEDARTTAALESGATGREMNWRYYHPLPKTAS
jgi:hypothetical protein